MSDVKFELYNIGNPEFGSKIEMIAISLARVRLSVKEGLNWSISPTKLKIPSQTDCLKPGFIIILTFGLSEAPQSLWQMNNSV